MADRFERILIFSKTMELCRQYPSLGKAIDHSIKNQYIIWQDDPLFMPEPRFSNPAEVFLSNQRTFEASKKYASQGKRVCALNFASFVTPGGGVLKGSSAQEESMCRISTLHAAISDNTTVGEYYRKHRQMIRSGAINRKNSDDCIFTPGVRVIREDTFDCAVLPENEWYDVDVITCAAPDLTYTRDATRYAPSSEELTETFENRWRRILSVAAQNKADVLILGAFGCGAFHNPPALVAAAFNNAFAEFKNSFETVEFAVYTNSFETDNYTAFAGIDGIKEISRNI